jgi:polysaccharide biosynthesis transport protein
LIETEMLDTRSKPPVVQNPDGFDCRISMRLRPSFGLGSLRSRKGLLGLGTVLFLAMGLFYTVYRPTTYTASSQLLVYIKQILTGADSAILPGRADLPLVQNQIELLRSGNVLTKVVGALQLNKDPEFSGHSWPSSELPQSDPSHPPQAGEDHAAYSAALDAVSRKLSVRQVGTSHMITVSFKASEPEKAARIVNNVIRVYLQELNRASDAASSKAPALRELYQSLGPSAHLVSEAEPPVRADGPPAALIVVVAALFGLGVAAAVAILLDVTNDTIRSSQQMEYVLGLECLGIIRRRADTDIVAEEAAAHRPHASGRQVLRRVAATILDAPLRGLRTIGVTSTLPGEGATTLAIGLAQTVAASGKRVLLIDGVPENPSVSRWVANSPRIPPRSSGEPRSKVLDGLAEAQIGLHVLPLAELPEGEANSMCPALLDGILSSATASYDLVIVDMPSLVSGPDVRAAAQSLDGFLLVVKWGATESELVRQGFQSAGEARLKFVGAVLNMADEKTMRRYGYELPAELKVATAS